MANSFISIKRTDQYINKLRKINIVLDGKEIGWIGNDELKSFIIAEGSHRLSAKIDWCSSQTVDIYVAAGDTKKV